MPGTRSEREIHVSLCFVEDFWGLGRLDSYSRWLSREEREQGERFVFEKDRLLHLLARVLVRTSLSRFAAVDPGAWRFRRTAHGRPEIASPGSAVGVLRFNVSHTAGLVACVVARDHEVGIDVESSDRPLPTTELASRFFSLCEAEQVEATPAPRRQERFLTLWTLKEAYLKARGFGLSLPLDSLCVTAVNGRALEIDLRTDIEPVPTAWSFLPFSLGACYSGAIAVRGAPDAGVRARVVRVLPFASEEWLTDASLLPPPRVFAIDLPSSRRSPALRVA